MWHSCEVKFPIDDNDIEGRRGRDGGEYGFEEIECGIISGVDRFRCGLEGSKGLVLQQTEMSGQGTVVHYGSSG